jgi:hypothetical protein
MHVIYAQKKGFPIKGLGFVHKSFCTAKLGFFNCQWPEIVYFQHLAEID